MATSFEPIMFSDLTEKTTAPSDADIIVIEDSTATKKAKWSSLISWIKSKLNIGSADISSIGDGTVTGAVSALNTKIGNAGSIYTNEVTVTGSGSWATAANITVPPGKYVVIRKAVNINNSDVLCGESYEVGNYASGPGGALAEYINTYNLTTQSDMTVFYYAGSGNSVKLSITAIAV